MRGFVVLQLVSRFSPWHHMVQSPVDKRDARELSPCGYICDKTLSSERLRINGVGIIAMLIPTTVATCLRGRIHPRVV